MKKLPLSYFQTEDTLRISRDLLGKYLVSNIGHQMTSGMIIETEAYLGIEDRASHAYKGRKTTRTKIMYLPGGHCYVYLCYGLHYLLNIVTHKAGEPHAILIRALKPCEGIEVMLKRRHMEKLNPRLTSGPGTVSQALGVTTKQSGEPLGNNLWIEDRGIKPSTIITSPRVGIEYAKEHALLPYRFQMK